MTTIKYCDLCKKEISSLDRTYEISLMEKGAVSFLGMGKVKAETCYDCMKEIESFIKSIKRDNNGHR